MPISRSQDIAVLRRMARRTAFMIAFAALGCNAATLSGRLDAGSRARLAAISGNRTVWISLTGTVPLGDLPPLDGGRVLARSGKTVLVEIPRGSLSRLAEVRHVESAVVWGDAVTGEKIEPALRRDLVRALDASPSPPPLTVIATFAGGATDLDARIRAAGAEPRTVAGTVATLHATPEAVFTLAQEIDLTALRRPREIRNADG
jgi:hypothetical protein